MTKCRWLISMIDTTAKEAPRLPWARGTGRTRWKSAARMRALAA